jgi:hypothetical protein
LRPSEDNNIEAKVNNSLQQTAAAILVSWSLQLTEKAVAVEQGRFASYPIRHSADQLLQARFPTSQPG